VFTRMMERILSQEIIMTTADDRATGKTTVLKYLAENNKGLYLTRYRECIDYSGTCVKSFPLWQISNKQLEGALYIDEGFSLEDVIFFLNCTSVRKILVNPDVAGFLKTTKGGM